VESPGHYKLEQHTPWFYEEHSEFVDQKWHAKLQWLQDSLQINADHWRTERGGFGVSNPPPPRNSEDIGGVLDRTSKKNQSLNFLL